MKATRYAEPVVYLLFVLVALAILLLVVLSPSTFLNTSPVYQGF